jgi:hypothetical protein
MNECRFFVYMHVCSTYVRRHVFLYICKYTLCCNTSMHGRLYVCVYVQCICTHVFINICVVRVRTPCMCMYVSANLRVQYARTCSGMVLYVCVFTSPGCVYMHLYLCIHVCMKQCKILYLRLELLSIWKTPLQLCRERRIAEMTQKNAFILPHINTENSTADECSSY